MNRRDSPAGHCKERIITTTERRVIGQPIARSDGPDKVTGHGVYSLDVTLPGFLWAKVLRSPFPHARIVRVDATVARALPGVHAVLLPHQTKDMRWGKAIQDLPVLASERVLFIGDPVAAVAAEDEDIAQQALDLIQIDYEEVPAVFTIEGAMASGAPIIHPDFNSYNGVTAPLTDAPPNVIVNGHWDKGDIHQGFAEAELVVERTFRSQRTHQVYLEPHNCTVWIDDEGTTQLWIGTKSPLGNRNAVAALFGLEPDSVNLNFAYVGGDFGGKGDILGVPICYLLAKETGRPVKFALDYSEEILAGNPRHESIMKVKVGVKRDGTITAWDSDLYFNGGAYRGFSPGGNLPGANEIAGPYKIPHTRIDSWQVATNTVPGGYQRGPGEVQGIFAGESMMDIIATELGMTPIEFRLKNVIHDGDDTPTGHHFQDIRAEEIIRTAVEASGFDGPKAPNVGRGIAYGHRTQFGGGTQVAVSVDEGGNVLARSSIFDPGVGTHTLILQAIAEDLGVEVARIRVVPFSTSEMSAEVFDFGMGGSRGSMVAPQASIKATAELKDELRRYASEFNGWDEEVVTYQEGYIVNDRTGARVSMGEVASRRGEPIEGRNHVAEEMMSPYTSFVAQVAEVEVEPETGQVHVRKITSVHDTAKVLNPVGFHGQVEGGLIQGFGGGVMEDIIVDEGGRVTNPSLADYKIPTQRDIPEINTVLVEAPEGWGEYKVKAVGEHSNLTTAPAITNAIADATGARLFSIPVHPEQLYRAMKE